MNLKKNDTYDVIPYQMTKEDGTPLPLEGATVFFRMETSSKKLLVDAEATIVDVSNGEVEYQLQDGDTIVRGVHLAEFTAVFPDEKDKTSPSDGFLQVTITRDIETGRTTETEERITYRVGKIEEFKNDYFYQIGDTTIEYNVDGQVVKVTSPAGVTDLTYVDGELTEVVETYDKTIKTTFTYVDGVMTTVSREEVVS